MIFMQWFVQLIALLKVRAFKISLLALVISLMGCAAEPFVTDEGSAAAQHADRQSIEFQEKGVPRRPVTLEK
jgi:hypothetical protein